MAEQGKRVEQRNTCSYTENFNTNKDTILKAYSKAIASAKTRRNINCDYWNRLQSQSKKIQKLLTKN